MKKYYILYFLLLTSLLMAEERTGFEYTGIKVKHMYSKDNAKPYIIKREIPSECKKKELLSNTYVWTGNYAHPDVPEACKSTYVHTTGKLQPIKLHDEVETYGELETLAFIKEMQSNDNLLLIDSRKEKWFVYMTIPSAINMPYYYFSERKTHEFEFEHALKYMGVKIFDQKRHYDFENAKILLIFCNGAWCSQSPMMIHALVEAGYPEEKIKWYRGGMQSWVAAGMTSTRK